MATSDRSACARSLPPPSPPALAFFGGILLLDAPTALSPLVEQQLWERVFMSGGHREIMASFREIYGKEIRALTYTGRGSLLADVDPRPLRLDDLGAGMRVAVRVLMAAMVCSGSALLLEEFDAYQHKASLAQLARTLCKMAVDRSVQLFMTTHSLESVHAFVAGAAGLDDGGLKIFPLELGADGTLTARGMERGDALRLLEAGVDLRDLTSYAKK